MYFKPETRYCWRKKNLDDLKRVLKIQSFDSELTIKTVEEPILYLLKKLGNKKTTYYFLSVHTDNIQATFSDYTAFLLKRIPFEDEDQKLYEISKNEYPHRIGINFSLFKKIIGKHKL